MFTFNHNLSFWLQWINLTFNDWLFGTLADLFNKIFVHSFREKLEGQLFLFNKRYFSKDFLEDCRLYSFVINKAKLVRCTILHNTLLSFAKQLTPHLLKDYFRLNSPHTWTTCNLLQPLVKREVRLPNKLINFKRHKWIVVVKLLTSFGHSLHHINLNFL